jgi:hypothetical protein
LHPGVAPVNAKGPGAVAVVAGDGAGRRGGVSGGAWAGDGTGVGTGVGAGIGEPHVAGTVADSEFESFVTVAFFARTKNV